MSEENWSAACYSATEDPKYPRTPKEAEYFTKSVSEGGLGLSRTYIHRNFPRRVYNKLGATKLVNNETEQELAISDGWQLTAVAPKEPEIVIKGQTQAEFESQARISKLEQQLEQQNTLVAELMQFVREKAAVQIEPRKRGRPATKAVTE